MAELVLCTGLDPDDPDSVTPVVIVAERRTADEDAVARLGLHGHEGDGCLYFVRTDGWAERRLEGGLLTVDIVAYPVVLKGLALPRTGSPNGRRPIRRRCGSCG